jgi:glycosyltransferase involved in cell wall biosynthesis
MNRNMGKMPTVGFVIHRFGPDMAGGAEALALELAKRLRDSWRIEVLTSCARDYSDWANRYPAGLSVVNGIPVRRFPAAFRRSRRWFPRLSSVAFRLDQRGFLPGWAQRLWLLAQGPVVPGLLRYLRENRDRFDAFIFFTYLYYPTMRGLPLVAEKSILIPTCHDEPPARFSGHRKILGLAAHRLYLSEGEAALVRKLVGERADPSDVAGFGIDVPETHEVGPRGDFFLYAGRVERGKNCDELFEFSRRAGIKLVVIGPSRIPLPDYVDYRGVVSGREKMELLSLCRALIVPSKLESLSIIALEAFAAGTPLIVNSECRVLSDLVRSSGGGYCYMEFEGFLKAAAEVEPRVGEQGRRWVEAHCRWEAVLPIYREAIERILSKQVVVVGGAS